MLAVAFHHKREDLTTESRILIIPERTSSLHASMLFSLSVSICTHAHIQSKQPGFSSKASKALKVKLCKSQN